MLRRFWLLFAQAVTVLLALLFIIATLKPQWLQRQGSFGKQLANPIIALQEVAPSLSDKPATGSYADGAQKAMPAVVSIFPARNKSRIATRALMIRCSVTSSATAAARCGKTRSRASARA